MFGTSVGHNQKFYLVKENKFLYINGKRARVFMNPSIDCTRKIYILDNTLFKFDVRKSNIFPPQGLREVTFYDKIVDDMDRVYFTEPIDWGVIGCIFWIAQKFEELKYPVDYSDEVSYLVKKYSLFDIVNDPIEKAYNGEVAINWAMKNGQPIIYDYPPSITKREFYEKGFETFNYPEM